jgi:hypothetical protein
MGRVYDTEPENRLGPASASATDPADTATADTGGTADSTPAIPEDDPPPF